METVNQNFISNGRFFTDAITYVTYTYMRIREKKSKLYNYRGYLTFGLNLKGLIVELKSYDLNKNPCMRKILENSTEEGDVKCK